MDFRQHTVLVTGGSSGIGAQLCRQLHARGAQVLIAGRDRGRLEFLAHELPGVATFQADLASPDQRAHLAAEVTRRFPRLSLLVNNAAVQHPVNYFAPVDEACEARWRERAEEEIAVNCSAVIDLTLRLMPVLRAAPAAAVVLMSSGLGLAPKKSSPVYCATKAFLHSFSKGLRYQCEDGATSLRVIEAILPLVDTPMTAGRGLNKMPASTAARAVLAGIERGETEINVGRVKLLRVIQRISPALAERILRNG